MILRLISIRCVFPCKPPHHPTRSEITLHAIRRLRPKPFNLNAFILRKRLIHLSLDWMMIMMQTRLGFSWDSSRFTINTRDKPWWIMLTIFESIIVNWKGFLLNTDRSADSAYQVDDDYYLSYSMIMCRNYARITNIFMIMMTMNERQINKLITNKKSDFAFLCFYVCKIVFRNDYWDCFSPVFLLSSQSERLKIAYTSNLLRSDLSMAT